MPKFLESLSTLTNSLFPWFVDHDPNTSPAASGASSDHNHVTFPRAHNFTHVPTIQPVSASMRHSTLTGQESTRTRSTLRRSHQALPNILDSVDPDSRYDDIEDSDIERDRETRKIRRGTPPYKKPKSQSSAPEFLHSTDVQDVGRLLGDTASKTAPDAVFIDLPGRDRMMKIKAQGTFTRGPYHPHNSLDTPKPSQKDAYRQQHCQVPNPSSAKQHGYPKNNLDSQYIESGRATKKPRLGAASDIKAGRDAVSHTNGVRLNDQDQLGSRAGKVTPTLKTRESTDHTQSPYFNSRQSSREQNVTQSARRGGKGPHMNRLIRKPSHADETIELEDSTDDELFAEGAAKEKRKKNGGADHVLRQADDRPVSKQSKVSDATRSNVTSSTSASLQQIFGKPTISKPELTKEDSPDALQEPLPTLGPQKHEQVSSKKRPSLYSQIFGDGQGVQAEPKSRKQKKGQLDRRQGCNEKIFSLHKIVHGDMLADQPYAFIVNTKEKTFAVDAADCYLREGLPPMTRSVGLHKLTRILWNPDGGCKIILETSLDYTGAGVADNKFLLEMTSPKAAWELVQLVQELVSLVPTTDKSQSYFDNYRKTREKANISRPTMQASKKASSASAESRNFGNKEIVNNKHPEQQRPRASNAQVTGVAATGVATVITGAQWREPLRQLDPEVLSQSDSVQKEQHRATRHSGASATDYGLPARDTRSRTIKHATHGAKTENRMSKSANHNFSKTAGLGPRWRNPLVYPHDDKAKNFECVQFDELSRLDDDELLNDSLVAFYVRYLEYYLEQQNPRLWKKMHFFNSYFYEKLIKTEKNRKGINFDGVKKWTSKYDLFSRDFVVVPVNESLHWYVAIICNLTYFKTLHQKKDGAEDQNDIEHPAVSTDEDAAGATPEDPASMPQVVSDLLPDEYARSSFAEMSLDDQEVGAHGDERVHSSPRAPQVSPLKRNKKKGPRRSLHKYDTDMPVIITLDSLGTGRSATCSALRQYVVAEALEKKGWEIDGSIIKGMTGRDIPTQGNYSDCGIYLCAYLERFVLDPVSFVRQILQREPQKWPDMQSEVLRSRFRDLLLELHRRQNGEQSTTAIPDVGKILLHGTISDTSPVETVQSLDKYVNEPAAPAEKRLSTDELHYEEHENAHSSKKARQVYDPRMRRQSGRSSPDELFDEVHEQQSHDDFLRQGLEHVQKTPSPVKKKRQQVLTQVRDSAITIDDDGDTLSSRSHKNGKHADYSRKRPNSSVNLGWSHSDPKELAQHLQRARSPEKGKSSALVDDGTAGTAVPLADGARKHTRASSSESASTEYQYEGQNSTSKHHDQDSVKADDVSQKSKPTRRGRHRSTQRDGQQIKVAETRDEVPDSQDNHHPKRHRKNSDEQDILID